MSSPTFCWKFRAQQEEATAAETILRYAEAKRIRLVLAAISLYEPFSTLTYYGVDRGEFVKDLDELKKDLARSAPQKKLVQSLEPVSKLLLAVKRYEMNELEAIAERILIAGETIALTPTLFSEAKAIEATFDLSPQDSIVFASVEAHVKQQSAQLQKCFASRNSRDYDDPALVARLKLHNCRYIQNFANALNLIQHETGSL